MQSFGWKRKASALVSRVAAFESDEEDSVVDEDVDWLTASKKPKLLLLEDVTAKAARLSSEGKVLACAERWWAAIGKWISAASLVPNDHRLHDMLAQAYMQVGEVFPSVQSAEMAVKLAPMWWEGHQTLGRAQLGLGEVELAIKSFSRAVHLRPDQRELWEEDLAWAASLWRRYKENKSRESHEEISLCNETARIYEVKDDSQISFRDQSHPVYGSCFEDHDRYLEEQNPEAGSNELSICSSGEPKHSLPSVEQNPETGSSELSVCSSGEPKHSLPSVADSVNVSEMILMRTPD